jgi:hypothetical protein
MIPANLGSSSERDFSSLLYAQGEMGFLLNPKK